MKKRRHGYWWAVLLLAGLHTLPARGSESPLHLTLTLERPDWQPTGTPALRSTVLAAIREASASSASQVLLAAPLIGQDEESAARLPTDAGDRDAAGVPRSAVFRAEKLQWLLLGGTLATIFDRKLLRQFDPDLNEGLGGGDSLPRRLSDLGTGIPMLVAIGTPYLIDGSYGRKTTRLALAALLDATVVTESLKFLTGKERPYESGGSILFHGPGTRYSSFPSGHTSASFAVATVVGHRYPRFRTALLILATAVGVSRINTARHFPSDVVVGAGIGIFAGRRAIATDGRILGLGWRF